MAAALARSKYLSIFAFISSLPCGVFVELLTEIKKIENAFVAFAFVTEREIASTFASYSGIFAD